MDCGCCLEAVTAETLVDLPCGHIIHEACYEHVKDRIGCPVDSTCKGSAFIYLDETEDEALVRLEAELRASETEVRPALPHVECEPDKAMIMAELGMPPEPKKEGCTVICTIDSKQHEFINIPGQGLIYYVDAIETGRVAYRGACKAELHNGRLKLGSWFVENNGTLVQTDSNFRMASPMYVNFDCGIICSRGGDVTATKGSGELLITRAICAVRAKLVSAEEERQAAAISEWEDKRAAKVKAIEAAIDVLIMRASFRSAGLDDLLKPLPTLGRTLATRTKQAALKRSSRWWALGGGRDLTITHSIAILYDGVASVVLPFTVGKNVRWTLSGSERQYLNICTSSNGWVVIDIATGLPIDRPPQVLQITKHGLLLPISGKLHFSYDCIEVDSVGFID
jgi:hypothetical protein